MLLSLLPLSQLFYLQCADLHIILILIFAYWLWGSAMEIVQITQESGGTQGGDSWVSLRHGCLELITTTDGDVKKWHQRLKQHVARENRKEGCLEGSFYFADLYIEGTCCVQYWAAASVSALESEQWCPRRMANPTSTMDSAQEKAGEMWKSWACLRIHTSPIDCISITSSSHRLAEFPFLTLLYRTMPFINGALNVHTALVGNPVFLLDTFLKGNYKSQHTREPTQSRVFFIFVWKGIF